MDHIIELDNVSYSYAADDAGEKQVLVDLNLSIARGSFTVILGHNGSGKSTLAKLLNGLYRPTAGRVTVDGMDTADEAHELDVKRAVGLVFQNPDNQLVASVVEEDVAFGPENLGVPPAEIRSRVDAALHAVDMYEYRTAAPHKLSGGQKQRVAIAGVIAMEPDCLVLDEPTAMLDPRGRREVLETLVRLNRDRGITVVLITHYMNETEPADRVLVLHDGALLDDGAPREVFRHVSLLRQAGLDLPQTTDLLDRLRQAGLPTPEGILSVPDCVQALLPLLRREVV